MLASVTAGVRLDWKFVVEFATVGAFLAGIGGLATYWHNQTQRGIEAEVADPAYRAELIDRHDCRAAAGYYASLDRLLAWTDRAYGAPLGWQAFNLSLLLAYVYPLLAALIGWIVANQTAPGGLALFPDTPAWADRLWRGALTVGLIAVMILFLRRADRWSKKLGDFARKRLDTANHRSGFLAKADRWLPELVELLAVAVAFAVAFAGAFAGAVAVAGAFAFAGAVAFAVAVAFAGAVAVAGAVAFAFAFAVVFAFAVAVLVPVEQAALIVFLYALLPLANATADWLSLAITRTLLRDMARRRPDAWGLAGHLILDLIAGAICLVLLLAGLVGLLELWATIHPASLPFDWRAYWAGAQADPVQGMALWLMTFTTLLPTLVHAVFSLTLWQTQKSDYTRAAVAKMRDMGATVSDAARIDVARLILRGRVSGFLRGTLYWGVPLATMIWVAWNLIQS